MNKGRAAVGEGDDDAAAVADMIGAATMVGTAMEDQDLVRQRHLHR